MAEIKIALRFSNTKRFLRFATNYEKLKNH